MPPSSADMAAAIEELRQSPRYFGNDRHGNFGLALSDRALAKIVAARAAGLEATSPAIRCLPGLRLTAAARAGQSEAADHAPRALEERPDCQRYIRQGTRWDDNPAADSDCNRGGVSYWQPPTREMGHRQENNTTIAGQNRDKTQDILLE